MPPALLLLWLIIYSLYQSLIQKKEKINRGAGVSGQEEKGSLCVSICIDANTLDANSVNAIWDSAITAL